MRLYVGFDPIMGKSQFYCTYLMCSGMYCWLHTSKSHTDTGVPECQKSWLGQAYTMDIICPPAPLLGKGFSNLLKELVGISSLVPIRSTGPDPYMGETTDYGRPVRKSPSLHGRKSTPTPSFLGMAEALFVCHIGPNFQIFLNYAVIGCS